MELEDWILFIWTVFLCLHWIFGSRISDAYVNRLEHRRITQTYGLTPEQARIVLSIRRKLETVCNHSVIGSSLGAVIDKDEPRIAHAIRTAPSSEQLTVAETALLAAYQDYCTGENSYDELVQRCERCMPLLTTT